MATAGDVMRHANQQLFNQKAGQSPTSSPPGMRKRDYAIRTYIQTGYATAT